MDTGLATRSVCRPASPWPCSQGRLCSPCGTGHSFPHSVLGVGACMRGITPGIGMFIVKIISVSAHLLIRHPPDDLAPAPWTVGPGGGRGGPFGLNNQSPKQMCICNFVFQIRPESRT